MPRDFHGIEAVLDAVLFDFDGVIVESMDIKTAVFRALFAEYPAHVDAIAALHEKHGGISRHVKFDMIYRDILRQPLSIERKVDLGRRFERMVVDQVVACPMVAGAQDVLQALASRLPLAVVSGTPDAELNDIVARRGLSRYFAAIHGSPRSKSEIIADLLCIHGWRPQRTIMVGDAMSDFEAARAAGLSFIGRVPAGRRSLFSSGTAVIADLTQFDSVIARLQLPVAAKA